MNVNFISEITGFYRFTQIRQLSSNAQLLWFHLFCLWNSAGFPDWLQVDMMRMMCMIQVNSKNVLIRAKEELIDAGLIICERGVNRQPNKYQFILFGEPNVRGSQKQPKNEPQTGSETGSETGPLYKLNNTKPKVKKEKAAYGQFGKVLLTEAEVAMLQSDFPDTWADWIKRLDIGKESKGYVYANDYAAIHSWKEKDEEEQRDLAFQEMMAEAELFSG